MIKPLLGSVWLKRLAPALLLGLAAIVVGAGSKIDWLLSPKHAFVLLPPTLITDHVVQRWDWSPNGAYLLVDTIPKAEPSFDSFISRPTQGPSSTGPVTLFVWDRSNREVRKLWTTDDASIEVTGVTWLHGSSTVYITMGAVTTANEVSSATFAVLAIDAATGSFSWVPGLDRLNRPPQIYVSPTRPIAVAMIDLTAPPEGSMQGMNGMFFGNVSDSDFTFSGSTFVTLGPNAVIKKRATLADSALLGDTGVYVNDLVWNKDGSAWYLSTRGRRQRNETVSSYRARVGRTPVIQELGDSGALTPVSVDLYAAAPQPIPELALSAKPMLAKNRRVTQSYNNLWISSPETTFHPDVLVTPNAQSQSFSPTHDAVFFIESGIAKVRTLQLLTDDQKGALFKALRAEALSNAKQAALGLLMYSNDADDNLPPFGGVVSILPYLKNQDILDAFNYTPPPGLNTTQIDNPAGTVIGYVDGPGGRAVAYVDGHAKWIPDP
jgi:hypothetical protein